MAITLPQDQPQVNLAKTPTLQIGGTKTHQISSSFLDIAQRGFEAKNKLEREEAERKKREQETFIEKQYRNRAADLSLKAKSAVAVADGENAAIEAPRQRAELKKRLADSLNKVPPEMKDRMILENQRAELDFERTAIPREMGELRKVKNETYKVDLKNQINRAVEMSGNLDALGFGLEDVAKSAREHATLQYGPGAEDLINFHVAKSKSTAVLGSVQQKAAMGDVGGATETTTRFLDDLTPSDRILAQREIEKATVERTDTIALEMAQMAGTQHPNDPIAQEKFLAETLKDDGEIYVKATSIARANNTLREKETKKREEAKVADAYNRAEEIIASGGAITQQFIKSVPEDKRSAIVDYIAKRGRVETDPQIYTLLMNRKRDDPEAFMATDFGVFTGKLSKQDRARFETQKDTLLNAKKGGASKVKALDDKTVSDVVDRFILMKGFTSDKAMADVDRVAAEAFTQLQDVPGMTRQEIRNRVSRALYDSNIEEGEVKIPGSGIFGSDFFMDKEKRMIGDETLKVDLTPYKGQIKGVHPSIIQGIDAARARKGLPPANVEEMRIRIEKLKSQNIDVTKPLGQ